MGDWKGFVREHLPLPRIERRRAEEIVEELAEQLEEIHELALARGATTAEADEEVRKHVGDWEELASDLAGAERRNREPLATRWLDRAEEITSARGGLGKFLADLVRDARYALRGLRRDPGFSVAVVVVLALGIGATTSMFAVVDALLLEPLPYPDPDRLVMLWTTTPGQGRSTMPLSGPNYADILDRSSSFDELGVQDLSWVNLSSQGRADRVRAALCTPGVLSSLGVGPALGRLFTERELQDKKRVAILSEKLWQSYFGGQVNVVGSTIAINGDSHTVVGIMPEGFTTPRPWYTSRGVDLWLPIDGAGHETPRAMNWLFALGRLAPGVTLEAANAEVKSIAAALAREHPDTNARTDFWIMPLTERLLMGVRRPVLFLAVGAAMLLLIAAANVSSIFFARATARQPLAAIRASLGASRARLVRQLATESLVISGAGGLLGLLVAWWGVGVLRRAIPPAVQRAETISLDASVLAIALAATVALGVLVGLTVGLAQTRPGVGALARQSLRSHSRGRRRARLHGVTVAVQFALTLLLANGSALMLRSYLNAAQIPLAIDTSGTLTAGITLEGDAYEDGTVARALWDGLVERVSVLPGVEEVGLVSKLPLNGGMNGSVLVEDEEHDATKERPLVEFSYASSGYFGAIGLDLLEGRTFLPEDVADGFRGLVVNRAFAEGYYPGESALGKIVTEDSSDRSWSGPIVGVVEDVPQWGLERPVLREVYFPFEVRSIRSPSLVVGVAGPPARLTPAIRGVLQDLDPNVPLANVRTMAEVVDADLQQRRLLTLAMGLFTALGLILGGTGLYGVVAYHVARRRHEIGIRMAIGAERRAVVGMVLWQGLLLAGIGTLFGLVAALIFSKSLAGLLFGVAAVDGLSIVLVVSVLVMVAVAGTAVPAFRAASINPVETLRSE